MGTPNWHKSFDLKDLLQAWLDAAMYEWEKGVKDFEPGQTATPEIIHEYFVANGWGNWNGGRYTENAKTSWCGHFGGAMGQRLGAYLASGEDQAVYPIGLHPEIARFCYPSTRRLGSEHKWMAAGVKMPVIWRPSAEGKPVASDGRTAQSWEDVIVPGMTCTVETSGNAPRSVGDHVVTAICVEGQNFHTVEGNGHGYFPDGSWGEGVVVRDERKPRSVSDIRMAVELALEDHFEDWSRHNDI